MADKETQSVTLRTLGQYRTGRFGIRFGLEALCSDARRINCAHRWPIPISAAIEVLGGSASPEQVYKIAKCPACRSSPRWLDTVVIGKRAGGKPIWGFGQWDKDL